MLDNSSSTNITQDDIVLDRTVLYFSYFIVLGIIIVLGFIFNSLSILVFIKSKALRQSTTGLYLVSLAIADLLFLFGEMLRWLDTDDYIPGYDFLTYSNASCQFVYSLRYSAKLTSAWITVVITTERFFIVVFPLRASTVCTCKKAVVLIIVTYGICFTIGSLSSLTLRLQIYFGNIMCGYHGYYHVFNWIVLRVGSLLLPGAVVLSLTIVICVKLFKARSFRHRKLSIGQTKARTVADKYGTGVEKQLTAMLLAVAFAFVGLRLPYTVMFYVNDLKYTMWDPLDPLLAHRLFIAYKITDLLAALNYAVNFFLYCISGSIFRRQFLHTIGCREETNIGHTAHAQGSNSNQTFHGMKSQNSRHEIVRGKSGADLLNAVKITTT